MPLSVGFARAVKNSGRGKGIFAVRFYIELFGGKGGNFGINNNGNPPASDPGRQGGNGGYTKLDMTVPTAYVITTTSYSGGTNYISGGNGTGFSIDGQWMGIVGGGGGASGNYVIDNAYSPSLIFVGTGPAGGAGQGGYSGTGTGSAGGNSTPNFQVLQQNPYFATSKDGGSGGGGADGGAGGGESGGAGGTANIRIEHDQGILDGYLTINPDIKMTYVTHTNGTSTSQLVRITNYQTGRSADYSASTTIPIASIANL